MSQFTPPFPPGQPPVGYGLAPQRPRGNGFAVASLVIGLVGCVPLLSGLLAIVFGIVGIRKTRDPAVGGKGLAVAGLVLGILGLLGWGAIGTFWGFGYLESKKGEPVAEQFLNDVCAGKVDAAMANASGIRVEELKANVDQLGQFGTLQGVTFASFNCNTVNGQITLELGGIANFSKGPKTATFTLVKQGGTYKVAGYQVK